jgi:hypothetical protein
MKKDDLFSNPRKMIVLAGFVFLFSFVAIAKIIGV